MQGSVVADQMMVKYLPQNDKKNVYFNRPYFSATKRKKKMSISID